MKHCRVLYRPWRVPTLISYPPPPPAVRPPVVATVRPPREPEPLPPPPRPRSRSERLRRDCLFLPDMDVAMQVFEARRKAAEVRRPVAVPRTHSLDAPLAVGILMVLAPPLAVTLVWSSPRYARPAQIALTAYGALCTVVLAAAAVALLAR